MDTMSDELAQRLIDAMDQQPGLLADELAQGMEAMGIVRRARRTPNDPSEIVVSLVTGRVYTLRVVEVM